MRSGKYFTIWLNIFLVAILLFVNFSTVMGDNSESKPFTDNDHLTASIWDLTNNLNQPEKALVLTIEQKQWQASVAVCMVPAFIGRASATPLMISDGSGEVSTVISYDTKSVIDLGSDAPSASAAIAINYWSKAELVFAVEKYEKALWIVPSAAFLGAPILVSPKTETLNSLGTKYVVAIGNTEVKADKVIKLTTKEDVWSFQLELFDTKGAVCNYVVLTNPHDTDEPMPENIKWSYQSPAAGLLAAYRKGIVQTGDWSVDREAFEKVETATDPDETNYNKIKPGFTKLKSDSYLIEKFLQDHGHTPEYLAAVGGPYAVPNFVYDIHVDYYFPTKKPQKTQYPSSLAAYATMTQTVDEKKYSKEDLAAGRLAAGNIFDLSKQLMRSFFYREFLPGGDYHSSTPTGWEKKACFADGHRLNQPEPDSLYWDYNKPYFPFEGISPTFDNAGLITTYYLPRNESDPYDTNMTINNIMDATTNYGFFHFMPHGGMTNLRIEIGVDNITGRKNQFLEATTIDNLNYKAPTLVYTSCCKGAVWMLDKKADGLYEPSDFIPASFIHAGAVAYIATPEIQSGCFWKDAPYSVTGEQASEFWKNALTGNTPIGKAWRDAKWQGHSTWENKTPKPESPLTHHVDCISYTLFGDPALEIYKPNIPFKETKEMDLKIDVGEIKSGKEFTVTITLKDMGTGGVITDAMVKVTFQGTEQTGTSVKFTAPKEAGEYTLTVKVDKTGYQELDANGWVEVVEPDDDKPDDDNDTPFAEVSVLLIATFIVIIFYAFVSKNKKKD